MNFIDSFEYFTKLWLRHMNTAGLAHLSAFIPAGSHHLESKRTVYHRGARTTEQIQVHRGVRDFDPRSVGMVVNDAEQWLKKLHQTIDKLSDRAPSGQADPLRSEHSLEHPEETRNVGRSGWPPFPVVSPPVTAGITCSSVHLQQLHTEQNWANEESQTGSCGDGGLLPDVVVSSEWLTCEVPRFRI